MMRGRLLLVIMPQQERVDTIDIPHPEGSYIYIYIFIENSGSNQTHPQSSENGSKMRRFTTHPHTFNLQGCSRFHEDTANQTTSLKIRVRESKKNKLELPGR